MSTVLSLHVAFLLHVRRFFVVRCRSFFSTASQCELNLPRHAVRDVFDPCKCTEILSRHVALMLDISMYILVMISSCAIWKRSPLPLSAGCLFIMSCDMGTEEVRMQLLFRAAYSVGYSAASRRNMCSLVIISGHRSAFFSFAFRLQKVLGSTRCAVLICFCSSDVIYQFSAWTSDNLSSD